MIYRFPKNFLWGAATSAHQVEGNNFNDWTKWEKSKKRKKYLKKNNFISKYSYNNYISGKACDHYNRYQEDFDIAKKLNHNAHRFSIEWSRIEPEQGKFDQTEIEHYRKVILALRQRNIEPFVTLWHWPLPVWFAKKGGFEKSKNIKYFIKYSEKIVQELGQDIKFWITLNEPNVYASNSFLAGNWPPQKKNIFKYRKVLNNLIKSHKLLYNIIKKNFPDSKIGISKNNIYFKGFIIAKLAKYFWNTYFLNKIKNHQDFIGLNYYYYYFCNLKKIKEITDMGWKIYPKGIYYVLKDLKKYNKPIYITENGLADAKDNKREKFIKNNLYWVYKAIQDGADTRGYLHWSLMDNFEWDKGFWPKFGLIDINRNIKKSAYKYAKICKKNKLEL